MKRLSGILFFIVALSLCANVEAAQSKDASDSEGSLEVFSQTGEAALSDQEVYRIRMARGWASGLLATGFSMSVAGAIMAMADPYGKVGLTGFIGVGVGLAFSTVSFILFGIYPPVRMKLETAHWSPRSPGTVAF